MMFVGLYKFNNLNICIKISHVLHKDCFHLRFQFYEYLSHDLFFFLFWKNCSSLLWFFFNCHLKWGMIFVERIFIDIILNVIN
jgi:hypothetical protein